MTASQIQGKQLDGSAKTREMKVAAAWQCADQLDEHGHAKIDTGSATYTAAIESARTADLDPQPAPFVQRIKREARRRGFYDAERQVVIGDGAPWIWNAFAELFPAAIRILDICHAKEKIHDLSKVIFGRGHDLTKPWGDRHIGLLRAGQIDPLIKALRGFESACKNVIGTRLKRGGMFWTATGANEIAALRACILSNRFDDCWHDRAGLALFCQ